jgi:hypothetical protein
MCDQTDDVPRVERAECAHCPQLACDGRTQLLDWVIELVDEFTNDLARRHPDSERKLIA